MSVKVNLDIKDLLKDINNSKNQSEIGQMIIKEMKDQISKGLSPVKGEGRFTRYKAQGQKKSKNKTSSNLGYPYSVQKKYSSKGVRPVNLYLTGEMLKALTYKTGNKLTIGILDTEQSKKAETHNDGTQSPKIPQRKFIPNSEGDEFNQTIQREIINIYTDILNDIILKSNK